MLNVLKVLSLGLVASAGCIGAPLDQPILRTQFGGNARRIATPVPASVARVATSTAAKSDASAPLDNAYTGAMQFSLRPFRYLYLGAEFEAGVLSSPGSSFAAAYSVAGIEASTSGAGLAIEILYGRQWLSGDIDLDPVGITAIEPRVRFQYLLDPQVAIGGMVGASAVPEERGWMGGLYIGIYSHPADGS
ncbi:MAG: hypothetical protein SFX73_22775 [Kofleriaceae bacterium]|nr:hypothetical protein [Kofleriaceae bacterium]